MPMISIINPSARDLALYAVYLVVVIDIFASALSVPIMPFYVRDLCGCESMDAAASCADPVCNRLGGATASLGFMFSSFAIAQLISNAWLGPLSDAVGRKAILGITLSGAAIGAFASGLAPTYSWLVGARIFIGFCSGTMSTANAYIADISNAKERPALMANVAGPCQTRSFIGLWAIPAARAATHRSRGPRPTRWLWAARMTNPGGEASPRGCGAGLLHGQSSEALPCAQGCRLHRPPPLALAPQPSALAPSPPPDGHAPAALLHVRTRGRRRPGGAR